MGLIKWSQPGLQMRYQLADDQEKDGGGVKVVGFGSVGCSGGKWYEATMCGGRPVVDGGRDDDWESMDWTDHVRTGCGGWNGGSGSSVCGGSSNSKHMQGDAS